jgi:hypothetical protein
MPSKPSAEWYFDLKVFVIALAERQKPGALWATEKEKYLAAAGYELRSSADSVSRIM